MIRFLLEGRLSFNHLNYSSRGTMKSVSVTMKIMGNLRLASSCLIMIEWRITVRLLSRAQHVLCVESRQKSEENDEKGQPASWCRTQRKSLCLVWQLVPCPISVIASPSSCQIYSPLISRLLQKSAKFWAVRFLWFRRAFRKSLTLNRSNSDALIESFWVSFPDSSIAKVSWLGRVLF